jgi:hypothetical protein
LGSYGECSAFGAYGYDGLAGTFNLFWFKSTSNFIEEFVFLFDSGVADLVTWSALSVFNGGRLKSPQNREARFARHLLNLVV